MLLFYKKVLIPSYQGSLNLETYTSLILDLIDYLFLLNLALASFHNHVCRDK